jgi:chemotaxis protein CheD
MPQNVSVRMGELVLAKDPDQELACLVGSCIAVCMYDPSKKIGAIAHVVLPAPPRPDPAPPGKYGTTAVPELIAQMRDAGCRTSDIKVVVCGGATIFQALGEAHNIGKRNIESVRSGLIDAKLAIAAEDVGGQESRTITLNLREGVARIRTVRGVEPRIVHLRG